MITIENRYGTYWPGIVISDFDIIHDEISSAKTKYIEKEDQGVVCFKSTKNLIPIDICIENVYKKTEVTLSPLCDPDFNVNLLCLYNNRIFNWAEDDDDSFSVEDIIRDITSMKAKKLFAFGMDDRILKIQNKGFKIY